jgi:hypothetical protein
MADIQNAQRNLTKIRMRCRLFWITLCGGLPLAVLLVPISFGAAKAVGLMWVILSIATWMSPMMSICPICHKPFHKGALPSGWNLRQCANCGLSLDEGKQEG